MWKKILFALLITILFPWSLLVLILLYGWDRSLEIFKDLLSGRYVLITVLIITVIILQLWVMPVKV
jgi:hypothetical protein